MANRRRKADKVVSPEQKRTVEIIDTEKGKAPVMKTKEVKPPVKKTKKVIED